MKKVIGILVLVFVFSLTANAQRQNQGQRKGMKADYTPEQMATLHAKKMTLHLDLSDSQQRQVYKLVKDNAVERKAMREEMQKLRNSDEKLDSNQRFALESKRIDKQIAHKAEMKKILDKDQFEKWEKFQPMKKRMTKKGSKGNNPRSKNGKNNNGKGNPQEKNRRN